MLAAPQAGPHLVPQAPPNFHNGMPSVPYYAPAAYVPSVPLGQPGAIVNAAATAGNPPTQQILTQISSTRSDGKPASANMSTTSEGSQQIEENPGKKTRGRGFSVVFGKATADPKCAGRYRPITIIACFKFARDLDVEVVRKLISERLVNQYPKFRCKVTFKGMCAQYFEELPLSAMDMQYHVAAEASKGWQQADVDGLLARLYAEDKDYAKPLWRFHLLNGLAGGGSMLVANVDHALGDGIGMMQVLVSLMDRPGPGPANPSGAAKSEGVAPVQHAPAEEKAGAGVDSGLVVKATPKSIGTLRWMKAKAKGTAQGLGQILMLKDRKTVLLVKNLFNVSKTRSFAVSEKIDLQQIKDIKNKVAGGSVNDVVATVINLALYRYLQERGDPIVRSKSSVQANYPVNLRRPGQTQVSNEIATSLLKMDFRFERRTDLIFRIKRRMDENKVSPQPIIERQLLKIAASILPTNLLLNLCVWLFTKFSIMMSNVPGPASQQFFAGAGLEDLYYFLFVPLGVYVGTLSYNGKVTFTIAADPEVEAEPSKFIKYMALEFAELYKEAMAQEGMISPPAPGCCG